MANRLINETSPYLLQHANNPVEWYPWGPEALARAKEEGKPILLSIGYAACHWCHVMERESFEDPDIAAVMNQNFVNIKVDREERPELDSIYMQAVQAMTGRGGWPMTVFLTPDLKPFYSGTYFPPEDRMGMPGFPRILTALTDAYRERRGDVLQAAEEVNAFLQRSAAVGVSTEPLTDDCCEGRSGRSPRRSTGVRRAGRRAQVPAADDVGVPASLLAEDGGAGTAGDGDADADADDPGRHLRPPGGGLPSLHGGRNWLVPHFEKMLYDNALLVRLYLHAYQATGRSMYRQVVERVLDYLLRDMRDPAGGFASSQDADSEGEEGVFYVWSAQELRDVLGEEDAAVLARYFGVTEAGNFEGRNVLHRFSAPEAIAEGLGMTPEALAETVARGSEKLHDVRRTREWPLRDDKVLTAWNAMVLGALSEAAGTLERPDYLEEARVTARFLLSGLRQDGRLLRTYRDGQAKLPGYLEDYAYTVDGLISLYEASLEREWLEEARTLADSMLYLFWDEGRGTFYDTARDHETLIVRPRDIFDNAMPCGGSTATLALLRLGALTGDDVYRRTATRALRSVRGLLAQHPAGLRALAVRAGLLPVDSEGGRHRGAAGRCGDGGAAGGGAPGLHPEQGGGGGGVGGGRGSERHPAAGDAWDDRRAADGLRVRELRVHDAGQRAGGDAGAAEVEAGGAEGAGDRAALGVGALLPKPLLEAGVVAGLEDGALAGEVHLAWVGPGRAAQQVGE